MGGVMLLMGIDEVGIKDLFTYSMVIGEEVDTEVDTIKTLGWKRDDLGLILRGVWFAS